MPLLRKHNAGFKKSKVITLTDQEIDAATKTAHDLGPGYPQLSTDWCSKIYTNYMTQPQALAMPPAWTPRDTARLDEKLAGSIYKVLGAKKKSVKIQTTFSGSVALNRAMTAIVKLARFIGSERIDVITTSPSIDIMALFLKEHAEVIPHFVPSLSLARTPFGLNINSIINKLKKCAKESPKNLQVVLLSSPENPTGEIWSNFALKAIAKACLYYKAVLIIDHCFLLAGVHKKKPATAWSLGINKLDWIAIWDTGKTIGFNEEKLGFILHGGPRICQHVIDSVNTIQFNVSRRQKILFSELLCSEPFKHHLADLRSVCKLNLKTVSDLLQGTGLHVLAPKGGTLALIDCSALGISDETIRRILIENDIGVIAGRVFFHGAKKPTHLIRIALARENKHFTKCVQLLISVLKTIKPT